MYTMKSPIKLNFIHEYRFYFTGNPPVSVAQENGALLARTPPRPCSVCVALETRTYMHTDTLDLVATCTCADGKLPEGHKGILRLFSPCFVTMQALTCDLVRQPVHVA